MELTFATMPRSGSEFLIRLTRLLFGECAPENVMPITPGRLVDYQTHKSRELKDRMEKKEAVVFFREKSPQWVKIEAPGNDVLCYELSARFPEMKWLTSLRKLDKIIISHYNIKTWGWSEEKIIHAYVCNLKFFEYIAKKGRLFVVNIDEPEKFNLQKMIDFVGCKQGGQRLDDFVKKWYVVNPLKKQKEKAGEDPSKEIKVPEDLSTLYERHPWLTDIDDDYLRLWLDCI